MAPEHSPVCGTGVCHRAGAGDDLAEEGEAVLRGHVVHSGRVDLDLDEPHPGRGGPAVRGAGNRGQQRSAPRPLHPLHRRALAYAGRPGSDLLFSPSEQQEPSPQSPALAAGVLVAGLLLPLCRHPSLSLQPHPPLASGYCNRDQHAVDHPGLGRHREFLRDGVRALGACPGRLGFR